MELFDLVTACSEHPTNLVIAAFGDRDFGNRCFDRTELGWATRCRLASQHQLARREDRCDIVVDRPIEVRDIRLRNAMFWAGQAMQQFVVIGDHDEPRRFLVESADGLWARRPSHPPIRQQVEHARLVTVGGHVTSRLVQANQDSADVIERFAIEQ